jgi:hypothetical protein
MPNNGEANRRFGVYINLCCGIEMVIAEGMVFPDCPNHPRLTTIWKPTKKDEIHKLPVRRARPDTTV